MKKLPDNFNTSTCGIKATGNIFEETFFFYTDMQDLVENAMNLMGYGSRDYNLEFFEKRPQPCDVSDILKGGSHGG